jgi:hypothetical protein
MELLRSTAPEDAGPVDVVGTEGRGYAGAVGGADPAPKRARRVKAAPAGTTRARNIRLSDDVHDRLWPPARERQQTASAVANHESNKVLPRYEVKRQA